jgi:CRP-like cAMP-binding protein
MAIKASSRGSVVFLNIFKEFTADLIGAGIKFIIGICSPFLIDLYNKNGFRVYSNAVGNQVGCCVPIIFLPYDWLYLNQIQSPLVRRFKKLQHSTVVDSSVVWFYKNFQRDLESCSTIFNEWRLKQLLDAISSPTFDLSLSILAGIDELETNKLTAHLFVLKILSGEKFIQAGQISDELFLVLSGGFSATLSNDPKPIYQVCPGQIFGEAGMLTGLKRFENIVANEESEIAVFSRKSLEKLMKTEPALCAKLLLNVARINTIRLVPLIHLGKY